MIYLLINIADKSLKKVYDADVDYRAGLSKYH
ncbi:hypothetical protein swp_1165 [Shewanella piezotolerans WP3]|uniref:Uncharacterized protein n=1 Tax=Shewanella piezotolerans (strain WP3 / JCM 13877) TaxID=225849 RepID=B8CKC2_SHEPW|nr:hypothetical protein swp_1165 [Shewanella piezotolerans WP3]